MSRVGSIHTGLIGFVLNQITNNSALFKRTDGRRYQARLEIMSILPPIFLSLFAGWMLWGWTVGESKNIKWMRIWCAPPFVVTTMLLSLGAGAMVSRTLIRRQARADVAAVLSSIRQNLEAGNTELVLSEIRATDQTGNPDGPDFDLLQHLGKMTDNLGPANSKVASEPSGVAERL